MGNSEYASVFRHYMKENAPVILDFYVEGGIRVARWVNTEYFDNYKGVYPKELCRQADAQGNKFPARFVIVSESESMRRKAVMYLIWRKLLAKYEYAMENNLPLAGSYADLVNMPEFMQVDLTTQEKTSFETFMSTYVEKLTEWHSVYYTGLNMNNLQEEFIRYMLIESKFNSFLGVSPQVFQEPQVQRLIYEQSYQVLFLPKEPEGYFETLGEQVFFQPAAEAFAQRHDGETFASTEQLLQGVMNEIPYVSVLGPKNVRGAIRKLRVMRGAAFQEADLAVLFDTALEKKCSLFDVLQAERLRDEKDLERMKGFEQIGRLVKRQKAITYAKRRNPKLKIGSGHYLFFGKPGTGKTEGARLYYEVMSSAGCISGKFVVASRKDIIGSYVGQTAPKVAELFDRAADGILFVDEAGLFLQQETGGFVKEAIKEFVRFMETRRDVCVIFAVYPEEKEKFLDLDKGLSSRISQIIPFKDYTMEELLDIADFMWAEQGYQLRKEGKQLLSGYLTRQKVLAGANFGNAREVRRLVELSIQETEMRLLETQKPVSGKGLVKVTAGDLQKAIDVCMAGMENKAEVSIGFRLEEKKDGKKKQPERFPLAYEIA